MGIIRLLLALSVVLDHAGSLFGLSMVGGTVAVQLFYIISGFYMALILNEKYISGKGSYKLFISNRFLRIYPIYWLILLLTLGFSICTIVIGNNWGALQYYKTYHAEMGIISWSYFAFSNVFIFFQDLSMYMGLNTDTGSFFLTSDFHTTDPALFKFLIIPQAWTVGLELMFYLIAPFIIKRSMKFIAVLIACSLAVRILLACKGLSFDPWNYRFFPNELALFLTGSLMYKLYGKYKTWYSGQPAAYSYAMLGVFIVYIFLYQFIPGDEWKKWILYMLFAFFLPFIFLFSKSKKWDQQIGELSYPVYISHMLVVMIVHHLLPKLHLPESALSASTVIATLMLSWVLIKWVSAPIERYRQSRVKTISMHDANV